MTSPVDPSVNVNASTGDSASSPTPRDIETQLDVQLTEISPSTPTAGSSGTEPLREDTLFVELANHVRQLGARQEDIDLLTAAFAYGREKHDGQKRKNGDNYITHPVEVAQILAGILMDIPTLMAAILHDTLEDTSATPEEIKKRFGQEVLTLVEGVTKLGKYEYASREEQQAENFRKMFLAMATDVRIIILKLCDRLHNMRTLQHMRPDKQQKIATETIEIFGPLANRLGMGNVRAELEDLSLQYLDPEAYTAICDNLAHTQEEREKTIALITDKISAQLTQAGLTPKIYGRVKHYYSIYKKMKSSSKELKDIFDISAIRIIVESEKDCYEVLGVIHNAFTPIPGRFKDYIAMPKHNLYQSLHTTVIGPVGRPLEVQIRTQAMHRVAEYGVAAHWRYKEAGQSVSAGSQEEQKLSWLKQMLDMKDDSHNAMEFVDSVKLDLFQDQVFVFSPKGKVIDLPKNSTPVDFAYRIHTEVGNQCVGAIVNGKIVPLSYPLRNGDIIEINTSKRASPKLDWIKFVQTQQAKSRIRQWFKKNYRDVHAQQGRELLEAELTRAGVDEAIKSGNLLSVGKSLNCSTLEDLFVALGYGEMNVLRVVNRLQQEVRIQAALKQPKPPEPDFPVDTKKVEFKESKHTRQIDGLKGMLYQLAKCCSPVPGEPIMGVVTRSRGVIVHREDCLNLDQANPNRKMVINWEGSIQKVETNAVKLEVHVFDRVGVFKDVLSQVAESHTNLSNAKVKVNKDHTAQFELTIDINNLTHLDKVKQAIGQVPDVIAVRRVDYRPSKQNGPL